MTAQFVAQSPRDVRFFQEAENIVVDHMDIDLTETAVNEVAEIFHTPLNRQLQLGLSIAGRSNPAAV
ncbi:MAG: hypothetical protein AseanaTS_12810 [Candidatus Pelagadaptatus aseana]|uniref:hypothetical protein n=1 Tax=Candidatus Pelagadaptatus aseana TaxID=3120508 RepID=UPI0039B26892